MRTKTRRRIILINGIHYFADRPETCRVCFFRKNRKVGPARSPAKITLSGLEVSLVNALV